MTGSWSARDLYEIIGNSSLSKSGCPCADPRSFPERVHGANALELFDHAMLFGAWMSVRGQDKLQEAHTIRMLLKQAEAKQKAGKAAAK